MTRMRIIPRLDIKGTHLIKGIHLEGLRVIGDPQLYASHYYQQGADELIYMDAVASLYGRNSLHETVQLTAEKIFVPLTVGGGIRCAADVAALLKVGADKVAINTAAVQNPLLISDLANIFGSQCIVISVEAKQHEDHSWEVYVENGREKTGLDVLQWCKKAVALGAGEILLTSIDKEGTRKGFDLALNKIVNEAVSVPVICSGGMGSLNDLTELFAATTCSGVAIADALHYERYSLPEIKAFAAATVKEVY